MGEILDGKGNVIVLKYVPGSASTTDRENGFIDTIQKEFPGIQIVDSKYGQDTVETALAGHRRFADEKQGRAGILRVQCADGCGRAAGAAKPEPPGNQDGRFRCGEGADGRIEAGQIDALVVQNPYKMGYEGVKRRGSDQGQPVEKKIDTGVALVTKDTLDDPEIKTLLNIQWIARFRTRAFSPAKIRFSVTSADDQSLLRMRGISKRFGPVQALADVTLHRAQRNGPRAVRRKRRREIHADENPRRGASARCRHD